MAAHIDNQRTLFGGKVVIYQRTDIKNTTWHCKIKFPKTPPVRQSLWTTDEKEATDKAEELYMELKHRHKRGLSIARKKFDETVAAYLRDLEADPTAKPKKIADHKAMSKYSLEYFGSRHIDLITSTEIAKYQRWRRDYWFTGPGAEQETYEYVREGKTVVSKKRPPKRPAASTINNENTLLRAVFNFAAAKDWIKVGEIPVIDVKIDREFTGEDGHRRPGLSVQEVKHLLAVSEKRLMEVEGDRRLYHQRFMLHIFVGIMATTGCRDYEAMNLKWGDIGDIDRKDGKQFSKVYVKGKRKQRWLVPLRGFGEVVDRLVAFTIDFKSRLDPDCDERFSDNETPIFFDYDGSGIDSFGRGFRSLIEEAGLYIDPITQKGRDAYCLRHYYATERLISGVPIYTLAKNMGTSVQMIERHYGHLAPEMAAEVLTQEMDDEE